MHKIIKLKDICTSLDYSDIHLYDTYATPWVYIEKA